MGRFLTILLAAFGVLFLALAGGVGVALWAYSEGEPELPGRMTLLLDWRGGVADGPPDGSLFASGEPTLYETVAAIDRAAGDPRVVGLLAQLSGGGVGLATAQELRDAVARFRAAGKPAFAYADDLGEGGEGTTGTYLAAGFDEIWLMPLGSVGPTGVAIEVPFVRQALDDLGIAPEVDRRGQFKSAPETFTERGFTPASRAATEALADGLYRQVVEGIAAGRGLSPLEAQWLIDGAPYTAQEALDAGLVDRLAYWADLHGLVAERTDPAMDWASPEDYLAAAPEPAEDVPTIALIYVTGLITQGEGDEGIIGAAPGADTIADAIDHAVRDDGIAAIVLRIDSGGGSAIASEIIGRAVRRAREGNKPLIASMGEAAASGGYWIAAPARAIVAQPATLTGSIGVFAGKPVLAELWRDIGVNWETVARGANAGMASINTPFSSSQRARLDAQLDSLYAAFVATVAKGRGLDPEAVEGIAQGRVWLGADAVGNGLVDRLGGLDTAIGLAKEAIGRAVDDPVEIVLRPPPTTTFEQIAKLLSGESPFGVDVLGAIAPFAARLAPFMAGADGPVAAMPPMLLSR